MSEMLANRYFYGARFADAAPGFEAVLRKYPDHVVARKKLVVCYVHMGRLQEALELALGLLREDPQVLARTDQESEGFPCGDTLEEFRKREKALSPAVFQTSVGVLQLFCNEKEAVQALTLASEMDGVCGEVRTLRSLVMRHMEAKHA
jgi:tetratricopeptide (TPR) repeat protein